MGLGNNIIEAGRSLAADFRRFVQNPPPGVDPSRSTERMITSLRSPLPGAPGGSRIDLDRADTLQENGEPVPDFNQIA